jgi:hypothetical protein
LALLLFSTYAYAQVIRGPEPFGQPTLLRATSPMAYWIWVDPNGTWHVRTTTARSPHVFEGVVTVEGGALTAVKPTKAEWGDTIRLLNPRQIRFKFQTMGGIDGFDFRANSPFVRFDIFIDGRKMPQSVFIGQNNLRPAGQPFDLYGPKLAPVAVAPAPVAVAIAPPPLPFKKPVRGPEPTGRPWFVATSPMSYWIWTDHNGVWHLRTTTPAQHVFHGYVTVEGGRLTSVKPTKKEWNDVVRLTSPAQVQFKFETTGGMDGFDFKADSPFVRFDIYIDGKRAPQAVKVGMYAQKPKAIPFDLYIPPPPPALAPPVQGPPPMGAPVFAKKSPQGFWIWADPDNTWHVRAVSLKPRLFDGVIYIENGRLTGITKTNAEWGDAVYASPDGRQVFFHLNVAGFGTDGFDFKATSRDVRFNVKVDKKVQLKMVRVGAMGASPAGMPFFSTNAAPVVAPPPPPPPPPVRGNPIYGRPSLMTPNSPMAYWIWVDPNGTWNIYVTTARALKRFSGRIISQDGVFTGLGTSRPDWGGMVRLAGPKVVQYDLRTQGTADGFRFRSSTPCIAFYPEIDGVAAQPQHVFMGAGNMRPTQTPFKFCR